MFTSTMLKTGLGIVMMSAAAVQAATVDEGMPTVNPPAISNASTARFLGGVRDFGDGRPSPNILYSTSGIAQATNSPEALRGPSVLSTGTPPPHASLGGGQLGLQGGSLERRTNVPTPIQPAQLERRVNTPYPVQSPWGY
jgi:hypothetical protein